MTKEEKEKYSKLKQQDLFPMFEITIADRKNQAVFTVTLDKDGCLEVLGDSNLQVLWYKRSQYKSEVLND